MMNTETSLWSSVGDWTHVALIVNASIFAYAVVMYNDSSLFDPVWQPDGFCVSNRDVPYWNSHDLCLYVDTILSILHGLLYLALRNQPGMDAANQLVKFNILGIFGHGLGHGAIAKTMREAVGVTSTEQMETASSGGGLDMLMEAGSLLEVIKMVLPFVIFWVLLLKATMPSAKMSVLLPMTAISFLFNLFVPEQFGFTYVQTVLLLAFSVNQLLRPANEKDFAYALFPMISGFPVCVIAWIESTMCSKGVMDMGGHLIYDAFIPISSMAFYLICWAVATGPKNKVKST